jgi:hypothetical protein
MKCLFCRGTPSALCAILNMHEAISQVLLCFRNPEQLCTGCDGTCMVMTYTTEFSLANSGLTDKDEMFVYTRHAR